MLSFGVGLFDDSSDELEKLEGVDAGDDAWELIMLEFGDDEDDEAWWFVLFANVSTRACCEIDAKASDNLISQTE